MKIFFANGREYCAREIKRKMLESMHSQGGILAAATSSLSNANPPPVSHKKLEDIGTGELCYEAPRRHLGLRIILPRSPSPIFSTATSPIFSTATSPVFSISISISTSPTPKSVSLSDCVKAIEGANLSFFLERKIPSRHLLPRSDTCSNSYRVPLVAAARRRLATSYSDGALEIFNRLKDLAIEAIKKRNEQNSTIYSRDYFSRRIEAINFIEALDRLRASERRS